MNYDLFGNNSPKLTNHSICAKCPAIELQKQYTK